MPTQTAQGLLTTLLVSYNTRELLDDCLGALRTAAAGVGGSQIIVVDNASRDGSAEHLETTAPDVTVIKSTRNVGFGRANNMALPLVTSKYLLLLNTDAFLAPDALTDAIAYMEAHPQCGVLGADLRSRDGSRQPSCRYFPTPWNSFLSRSGLSRWLPGQLVDDMSWAHDRPRRCDWVPGCYYLLRAETLDSIGLFDPRYFLYYEEVDHCLALRRGGWDVVFFPGAKVVHIGGESARKDSAITQGGRQVEVLQLESAQLYFRKNHGLSGLIFHLLLEQLGDLFLAFKALIKRRDLQEIAHLMRRSATQIRLARQTRLGMRPLH